MTGRDALGPVDVDDETLAEMLAADSISESQVEDVDYGLTTLTTGERWWVSGTARQDGADIPFRLFVKVVQSALRSPAMADIPPQFHEMIAAALPWHIEPNAYRSDLSIRVPSGMRIPRAYRVAEVDDESCALWLDAVEHDESPWDLDRYRGAAAMLGRFAGSAEVAAMEPELTHPAGPQQARIYFEKRLSDQFISTYEEGGVWHHPAVAAHFDEALRGRLMSLIAAAPELIDEIEKLPLLNAHGDAAPQNLLVIPDGFCVIDWGFWCRSALGFDLSQLVYSEIDLDRSDASTFRDIQDVSLVGYREGLAESGVEIGEAELERAHTIQLAIAHGISSVPLERLGDEPTAVEASVRARSTVLKYVLDDLGL
ncbi:phosphotransferase [Aeromicrobium sp.]|uniref:phosphotransferase n=1 Tax=Aeromicrobium sp. TaxID=1871063 RepID=UPI002FCA2ADB